MKFALSNDVAGVLQALCRKVDSPVSLKVSLLLTHGQLRDILRMKVSPHAYLSADDYRKDNACVEFLRKCRLDGVVSARERKTVALKSFWDSERDCARTNIRIRRLLDNHSQSELDVSAHEFLMRAKKWIKSVLGPLPSDLDGRFGPGATYSDRGRLTTVCDKITNSLCYTKGCEPLLPFITQTAWFRHGVLARPRDDLYEVSRGNRFTTVPKDALKDRGICIEPSANVFLQLAVGRLLKRRLKAAGNDLLYAQDWHRSLAQQGSRDGHLATIDLSSASDTVSYSLVELLLPDEWFQLLDMLRSPMTLVAGKWIVLEKFSSMGNGYTFELETLIFSALAHAVGCEGYGYQYSVFGDDIIVPSHLAPDMLALLRYCGFTPNENKTFVSGRFRESCGGDFFDGEPVRAHNLEEAPTTPEDWISLANGLRRLGLTDSRDAFRYSFPFTAWQRCLDALPVNIRRLRGPTTLGDLVIHDDERYWKIRWRHCIRYVRVYMPVAKLLPLTHWKPSVVYAAALYGGITSLGVQPRGEVSYREGWVAYS